MKRVFLLAAAIAVVASASASEIVNFVEVSGRSEIEVSPNEFTLLITIDEQATRGRYTVEELEKSMIKSLRKIGVDQKSLTMSAITSYTEKRRETRTRASYELELGSVKSLMECYDAFDDLGITSVRLTKATNSNMEQYRSKARIEAVKDAASRARDLGDALGQPIGECFELTDRSSYTNDAVYMSYPRTRVDGAEMAEVEPLEFRDITITYNVDAKFLLGIDDESSRMIVK